MSFLLEDKKDYEIYFSHQCDNRSFNRGATKNIGFLAIKNKYPEHYQNINFIFNDIDTIPFNKIFSYETFKGSVKHYYGYKYALGGIVVIQGSDFEKINGYPCLWGWGMEDYCLQKRCEKYGLEIDRSHFYPIGSPEILQLFDGISRIISKKDTSRIKNDDGYNGLKSVHHLIYTIDSLSKNPEDNEYSVDNPRFYYINIKTFSTQIKYDNEEYYQYDLREPKQKIVDLDPSKEISINENDSFFSYKEDWTNIPYYPTLKEKRENLARDLIKQGKPIPPSLIKQIQEDRKKELESDEYSILKKPIKQVTFSDNENSNSINKKVRIIQTYPNSNPVSSENNFRNMDRNPFQKPKKAQATASARIRLGGVY
jgi:Txe/YoeB family toxin of Txe-Axe toxin-antitoxin module